MLGLRTEPVGGSSADGVL